MRPHQHDGRRSVPTQINQQGQGDGDPADLERDPDIMAAYASIMAEVEEESVVTQDTEDIEHEMLMNHDEDASQSQYLTPRQVNALNKKVTQLEASLKRFKDLYSKAKLEHAKIVASEKSKKDKHDLEILSQDYGKFVCLILDVTVIRYMIIFSHIDHARLLLHRNEKIEGQTRSGEKETKGQI
jgi:hypothetical protein